MSYELYTVAEAANYLKLSTKTILRLIADEKITASKVSGRSWRIKNTDIEEYLKNNTNDKIKANAKEAIYND